MHKEYYSRPHTSSPGWLGALVREAEDHAAAIAPLAGTIRKLQRSWSYIIDVIEVERQHELEVPLWCAA